jgi:hypothetical protein
VSNLDRAFFVDLARRITRIVKVGGGCHGRVGGGYKQERKKERRARDALFDV